VTDSRRAGISIALALLAGLMLRAFMIRHFALVSGDGLVYGNIASNWLQHHVYGLGSGPQIHPTLIRLPGYPLFLAVVFAIFGVAHYYPVLWIQALVDLAGCVLIAALVRRHIGNRAALIALWLAALCPFTAAYTAVPLTETLSIFCVALALFASDRFLDSFHSASPRITLGWSALLGITLAYAILLRPDGGLLAAAVVPILAWRIFKSRSDSTYAPLLLCCILTLLPLAPWTVRNARVFHVFQPLAPRYANDPGELPENGYKRWTRTWFLDAVSNEEVYWCGDDCALDIKLLPNRAFDSAAQRQATATLLDAYNDSLTITPELDQQFAALARERIAAHPFRYHIVLPVLRLADMAFRPRTELFPIESRWWEWSEHPQESAIALALAAINLFYVAIAVVGFLRRRVPLAAIMLLYIVLRCALLLTLENAEPRYTLEFFPILFAAGAVALAGRSTSSPRSSSPSS
jgi:Dolichyl-phosphate-mannose-protein mannosyltransferase